MVEYAGYFGIVAGLWSRKATVVFVAATALVLLVGLCDAPYLALDLAPGKGVARLGTERLAQLARPFVFAAAGYGLWLVFGHARAAWRGAPGRQRWIAAALIGVMAGAAVRVVPAVCRNSTARVINETHVIAPDPAGRMQLEAWAKDRMTELGPSKFGRALFEEDTHEHMHLTASTGMPTFHMPPLPDMLLRERMEDTSAASLARFDVRWVVAIGQSPSLGDPDREITLGSYHIREVAAWDGKFARVERGVGKVVTTRLDDDAVEIEVTAERPVLVALGTGYYPRWRATHADGTDEPVYAMQGIPRGQLRVVSAWVKPGKTTFTCDAPLPSDHDGRLLSIAAMLAAAAGIVVWSRRRWRVRVLRRVASFKRRGRALVAQAIMYGVPLVLLIVFARSCVVAQRPVLALEVGSGIRGTATVEARMGEGRWETCGYDRLPGEYRCADVVAVYDAMAQALNDAPPSWPYVTPGIFINPDQPDVEVHVKLHVRLGGTYWAAVTEGSAIVTLEGSSPRLIDRKTEIQLGDLGERDVDITIRTGAVVAITFVRVDAIEPDRSWMKAPPEQPVESLR